MLSQCLFLMTSWPNRIKCCVRPGCTSAGQHRGVREGPVTSWFPYCEPGKKTSIPSAGFWRNNHRTELSLVENKRVTRSLAPEGAEVLAPASHFPAEMPAEWREHLSHQVGCASLDLQPSAHPSTISHFLRYPEHPTRRCLSPLTVYLTGLPLRSSAGGFGKGLTSWPPSLRTRPLLTRRVFSVRGDGLGFSTRVLEHPSQGAQFAPHSHLEIFQGPVAELGAQPLRRCAGSTLTPGLHPQVKGV